MKTKQNVSIFIMILFLMLLLSCTQKRGQVQYGEEGVIKTGTGTLMCTPPDKRYTSEIQANVTAELDKLIPDTNIELGIERKIVKLADYSQKGLDIDLILYRICEMSINRGFTNEQTNNLILKVIMLWNEEHPDNQKNVNHIIEGQNHIIEGQNQIIEKQDKLIEGQNIINDNILKLLEKTEEQIYERLKREYPLGYALHYLDGSSITYKSNQSILNIEWSSTKVIEFSDTKIVLILPDWIDANQNRFKGNITVLSRKLGSKAIPIAFGNMKTTVECIATDSKSAIVVIGFS